MKLEIPGISTPVRPGKLICIGRNYAAHAKEMNSAVPSIPMIFLKPSTALVSPPQEIVIPDASSDVHHEVELVAAIGTKGKNIAEEDASSFISALAVGIDLTARDIQAQAKSKGHPWSVSKGFDTFAPIGEFASSSDVPNVDDLQISLRINGETRQAGWTGDMIFDLPYLVAYCSTIFTLEPGDLIFTGTPEGVGPIASGDELVAEISYLPQLTIRVRS